MNTVDHPKKGTRFLHARILDEEALRKTPSVSQPALCEVTTVRDGCVYYRIVGQDNQVAGKSEYTTLDRWPTIVKTVISTPKKICGYAVTVAIRTGPVSSEEQRFFWKGSEAKCRQKGMLKTGALNIVRAEPLDEVQYSKASIRNYL